MAKSLPKIDVPLFEVTLPIIGEKVLFRPFKVKEEKVLLTAQESKDIEQIILTIKQVVNNCLQGRDVSSLPMIDLEMALLHLRKRSVDNSLTFIVIDDETGEEVKLELDLDAVQLKLDPTHTNKIVVNENYTMFMRYPSIDEFLVLAKAGRDDKEAQYKVMLSCIDKLASEDEVFLMKDFTEEEVEQFVEDLPGEAVQAMSHFFATVPKMRHEIKYKNSAGSDRTFVIEGLEAFFT